VKLRVRKSRIREVGSSPSTGAAVRPHWLAVGTLAASTLLGGRLPALAREGVRADFAGDGPAGALASAQPVLRYDIPAGPIEACLAAFETAAGLKLTFPMEAIRGLPSPGVSGVYTAEQALRKLLEGTGVTYRWTGQDAVALQLRLSEAVEVTAPAVAPASPKYTEPLRDIPQTITIIPRTVIEEQNATTLRDVLRNVPGITIQAGEGGVPAGDNLTIRGFSARTDIFIDGVRDFGGYSRDPYNVEQVEVVKGPASSFNGRGSTGGSVNLVSKTPQTGATRSLAVGGGSDAYKRATLDLNQPIRGLKGAAFRLNGMFTDTEVARRDAVENKRWGLSPSVGFGLGSSTRLNLLYSHLDQDNVPDYGIPWVPVTAAGGPLNDYVGMAPPVESSNFYGLTTRDYEKTKTDVATAIFDHDFKPQLSLRNQFRYGRNDRDSVITAPRFVNPASPTEYTLINRQLQSRDMTDTIVSNQASLLARFATGGSEHALVTGVDFGREDSTNDLRTGPTAPIADLFAPDPGDAYPGPITRTGAVNDGQATTSGVYAFDTVHFGPKFELTGGLRYDHFEVGYETKDAAGVVTPFGRTDDLFSWRAGAVYKPKPFGSVYAGLGTSFNPSAEGLSLAATNVNLEPEETRSFEVGTKWDLLAQRLSLTGAIFRTEKTNARTPGVNPGDPPQVLTGEQKVDGVEVGLFGSLGNRATVFAGYAHMWSEIEASNTMGETGNALAQTPEDTFNLWLTYRLPLGLTLGGGVQFMDSVYRNALNTLQAPSYWLVNATAAYPLNRKLTLRLNAYNLADEDYVDRVGGGHFVPGPGRYAMLTLDFEF
jgi:catecholate siderophore receptor